MPDFALMLAGVVGLGFACQWLAWRIRLPAILLLLLVGLSVGPGMAWLAQHGHGHGSIIDPDQLFGQLLLPVVSLSVALILFEGGLTLRFGEIRQNKGAIARLVTIGAIVTWGLATAGASFILHFPAGLAVLIGAILVVTGPTVIGPLLRFVKPTGPVAPVLRWEGIVIDPIGALLAVVVFEIVVGRESHFGPLAFSAIRTIGIGSAAGVAGAGVLMLLMRRNNSPETLHNPLAVAAVVLAFAGSNAMAEDSGLVAVTVMGILLANQKRVDIAPVLEFKESLSVLLVSSLFILLSARLKPEQFATLDWRVLAFIAFLVLIVRPASVWMSTVRSKLTRRERWFLSFMAPRGIVAASVASVFALRLKDMNYPGAERLVPATFAVVAGTVLVYGLTSPLISRWLGLSRPGQRGLLIISADPVARAIGEAVQREGYEVLMVDSNATNIRAARLAGLPTLHANALSDSVGDAVSLSGIGRVLAMTANDEVNTLVALKHARQFGRDNIYQIDTGNATKPKADKHPRPPVFEAGLTYRFLQSLAAGGATMKATKLTREFDWPAYKARYGTRAFPMFIIGDKRELHVITSDEVIAPKPGQTLVSLIAGQESLRPVAQPVATGVAAVV